MSRAFWWLARNTTGFAGSERTTFAARAIGYGMAGLRLGYAVGRPETMEKVREAASKLTAGWEVERVRQIVTDVLEEVAAAAHALGHNQVLLLEQAARADRTRMGVPFLPRRSVRSTSASKAAACRTRLRGRPGKISSTCRVGSKARSFARA